MENIKPTMDHYLKNGQIGDTDPVSYFMLAKAMNSLLPGIRVALESIFNNPLSNYFK